MALISIIRCVNTDLLSGVRQHNEEYKYKEQMAFVSWGIIPALAKKSKFLIANFHSDLSDRSRFRNLSDSFDRAHAVKMSSKLVSLRL